MARRPRIFLGVAVATIATLVLLASTGPNPENRVTGNFRRLGGPCLELEQWGLFGWRVIGQTHSTTQLTGGDWQPPVENPPCQDVEDQLILIRMPFQADSDSYRICGLADEQPCFTFQMVPFQPDGPGP